MLFHRFVNTANGKEYLVPLCAYATMKTALLYLYTSGQCKRNVELTYTGRVYKDIARECAERKQARGCAPMRKAVRAMGKWIERAVALIGALLIIWGVVSFIEVNSKNLDKHPVYWEYNMFTVLTEILGE